MQLYSISNCGHNKISAQMTITCMHCVHNYDVYYQHTNYSVQCVNLCISINIIMQCDVT